MSKRPKRTRPSCKERAKLNWSAMDLEAFGWMGEKLAENREVLFIGPDDQKKMVDLYLETIFKEVVPTFLLVKLAALSEETLSLLWEHEYPKLPGHKFTFEQKLKTLADDKLVDFNKFMQLWKLRNQIVHNVEPFVSWEQYVRFDDLLPTFLKTIKVDGRMPKTLKLLNERFK